MENVIFERNRIFKKISNTCFLNAVYETASYITILINTLKMGTVNINEKNMMFVFNIGGKHEFLLNTLICISKWSIWKTRNKVKYIQMHSNQTLLYNIWKQTLKYELNILLTAHCNDTIDETKILTILSLIRS